MKSSFLESMRIRMCVLSRVSLFVIPWTVALQAPLSMEFSRQGYWNSLPFPTPGDLSHLGTEPLSLASPGLAGGFFTTVSPGKPHSENKIQTVLSKGIFHLCILGGSLPMSGSLLFCTHCRHATYWALNWLCKALNLELLNACEASGNSYHPLWNTHSPVHLAQWNNTVDNNSSYPRGLSGVN